MNIIQMLNEFTMKYLDPLGIWIGLLLAIPVFSTWFIVLGQKRQNKKIWQQARKVTGNLPAVLIVDILPGKDISTNVRQHLNSEDTFKNIPEERIITLTWGQSLKPNDMPDFTLQLRKAISQIYNTGADRIYLFFGGPNSAATVIGSELANNIPTILYQYNIVQGKYENFGPLKFII